MLPSVMGVGWATALGESSSNFSSAATAQTDEAAATCIAHRLGPADRWPVRFPYAPVQKGGVARHGVGPHLGRLASAEMAGGEARGLGGHRGRDGIVEVEFEKSWGSPFEPVVQVTLTIIFFAGLVFLHCASKSTAPVRQINRAESRLPSVAREIRG
jgi:hypothetical protein